jgi:RNA polymerase sigma-70 factor (ECF subfamily)
MPTRREEAFASRLRDRTRVQALRAGELDGALAGVAQRGREAWPAVSLDDEAFAAFLADKIPDDESGVPEALAAMATTDLYLACACARGDTAGIEAFEKRYFAEVESVLRRVRDSSLVADDVRQMLREKLFVGSGNAKPKIADYAGKGALASWFRVTAMRLVLNLVRGPKEVAFDEMTLLDVPDQTPNPELEHLKLRYRAEFKDAFAATVSALSAQDRNLLRYAFASGLGSDEIATIYRVHRTTVNRWLVELRRTLVAGVRSAMLERLRVSEGELESILRLIRSQLEITFEGRAKEPRDLSG